MSYNDINCPYCNVGLEICHDDGFGYEEDEKHEMQCRSCDKNFIFTTSISFDYEPEKADCLNGEPHKLKESTTIPRRYTKLQCENCDYSEDLPEGHPFLSEEYSI